MASAVPTFFFPGFAAKPAFILLSSDMGRAVFVSMSGHRTYGDVLERSGPAILFLHAFAENGGDLSGGKSFLFQRSDKRQPFFVDSFGSGLSQNIPEFCLLLLPDGGDGGDGAFLNLSVDVLLNLAQLCKLKLSGYQCVACAFSSCSSRPADPVHIIFQLDRKSVV